MKINVVRIGNSFGIRIPKPFLEQCNIKNHVEVEVVDETITLKPCTGSPRAGWAAAFKSMHKHGDELVIADKIDADLSEWQW